MCPSKLGRDALLLMVLCVRDLAMYWLLVELVLLEERCPLLLQYFEDFKTIRCLID